MSKTNQTKNTNKPVRIHLIDWGYIWLTFAILCAVVAVIIAMSVLGWAGGVIGSIVLILIVAFGCSLVIDIARLATACITVDYDEGLINAGKNEARAQMVFHIENVESIEVQDAKGETLDGTLPKYRNVGVAFVMKSGKVNVRRLTYLNQTHLAAIRAAIGIGE